MLPRMQEPQAAIFGKDQLDVFQGLLPEPSKTYFDQRGVKRGPGNRKETDLTVGARELDAHLIIEANKVAHSAGWSTLDRLAYRRELLFDDVGNSHLKR